MQNKYPIIFIVVIFIFLPAVNTYTTPIMTPVIVTLDHSQQVIYTATKINSLLTNAILIDFHTFSTSLLKLRSIGDLILVGHGTYEGLSIDHKIVKWRDVSKLLEFTVASHIYVASCFSNQLQKYSRSNNRFIYTFKGIVDVDIASYVVSSMVYHSHGNNNKAVELLNKLSHIMLEKILEPWKHVFWFLYETKKWRNIWWVKWSDRYSEYVEYTHPDTYIHYTWIGVNNRVTLYGDNLVVTHYAKSELDHAEMVNSITDIIVGAIIGASLGGWVGAIVGAITALLLYSANVFINNYLRDESGSGWAIVKDKVEDWYHIEFDLKFGKLMWIHVYLLKFGWATAWFTGIGGRGLGYAGI